jgi:hypothetical protein
LSSSSSSLSSSSSSSSSRSGSSECFGMIKYLVDKEGLLQVIKLLSCLYNCHQYHLSFLKS